jgi:hypothetical protein
MNESYAERGYAERGYAERGYAEPGYAEPGYAEPGYARDGYARGGYARGGGQKGTGNEKSTRSGGVILAVLATLSSVLVILGLYYATGATARHKAAMAAAGCEPNLMSVNVGCTTVQMLVSQYNSVTNPAVEQLNADVAAYTAAERHNLSAAEMAVRAEVATADVLVQGLSRIPFPPFAAPDAKVTIRAIQARVKLMTEQARSSSLVQLRSFDSRIDTVGAAIQTDLKHLSTAVQHHPTPSQEPDGND